MGRRPHPIVSEYFSRGDKLPDASNRYAHTCKRCGERFPKGRVDNLTSHLLRTCSNMTEDDHRLVVQALRQERSEPHETIANSGSLSVETLTDCEAQWVSNHYVPYQDQSPLDTLAAVSQRHLHYSSQHREPGPDNASDDAVTEKFLLAEISRASEGNVSMDLGTKPQTPPIVPTYSTDTLDLQDETRRTTGMSELTTSTLIQTASAASQRLEGAREVPKSGSSTTSSEERLIAWSSPNEPGQHAHNGVSSTIVGARSGYAMGQRPLRNKISRTRFTDTRRKEVLQIRKRGACLRCRMLKKPCSEETPCNTCRSIESARLWKNPCVRSRLAEEFTLWATGYFHAKANALLVDSDLSAITLLTGRNYRVDAQLLPQTSARMVFAARGYQASSATDAPLFVLEEKEDVGTTLGTHVHVIANAAIDAENCFFMKETLRQAQAILQSQTDAPVPIDLATSRPSYSLNDQLLSNVVELWVETVILSSFDTNNIGLWSSSLPLADSWELPVRDDPERGQTRQAVSETNRELITAQVLAKIESRCLQLSRTVMNELERRLLQRQQVSRFATFISAVILLNCVERMTGTYRSFDTSPETAGSSASQPHDWPLDTPARALWQQGERFAELLTMLLRMRALPPHTRVNAEEKLVVDRKRLAVPVNVYGRSAREQTDEQTTIPAAWLDPMQIEDRDLVRIRDGPPPGPESGSAAWDLRYISRLLLPEQKAC